MKETELLTNKNMERDKRRLGRWQNVGFAGKMVKT